MPLFDFRCTACGREFEALVLGSDAPRCPACKSTALEKLMSTFAFRSGGGKSSDSGPPPASSSKCSGCAGGSCSSCH